MNFDSIIHRLDELGINLYDFAVWTKEHDIQNHRFQPCNRCNNSYSVARHLLTAVRLL